MPAGLDALESSNKDSFSYNAACELVSTKKKAENFPRILSVGTYRLYLIKPGDKKKKTKEVQPRLHSGHC